MGVAAAVRVRFATVIQVCAAAVTGWGVHGIFLYVTVNGNCGRYGPPCPDYGDKWMFAVFGGIALAAAAGLAGARLGFTAVLLSVGAAFFLVAAQAFGLPTEGHPDLWFSRVLWTVQGAIATAIGVALGLSQLRVSRRGDPRQNVGGGRHHRVSSPTTSGPTPPPNQWELAELIEKSAFRRARGRGYDERQVDIFLDRVIASLRGHNAIPISVIEIQNVAFSGNPWGAAGYDERDVDDLLDFIAKVLSTPQGTTQRGIHREICYPSINADCRTFT